jgi:hypothetical protein
MNIGRKINPKLIEELKEGDLTILLDILKKNQHIFRLESRLGGKCYVYYKKCKILELGLRSAKIDSKYFEKGETLENIRELIKDSPKEYLKITKDTVDLWLERNPKDEFEAQQKIASINDEFTSDYLILDMEYNFSQKGIKKNERLKQAGFDLLGLNKTSGEIILFEVKKGLYALEKKAGIASHIKDFEDYLILSGNKEKYISNLVQDVKNILNDKIKLGLLDESNIPYKIVSDRIDFVFILDSTEKEKYKSIFKRQLKVLEEIRIKENIEVPIKGNYQTIYVTKDNYKLI